MRVAGSVPWGFNYAHAYAANMRIIKTCTERGRPGTKANIYVYVKDHMVVNYVIFNQGNALALAPPFNDSRTIINSLPLTHNAQHSTSSYMYIHVAGRVTVYRVD